MPPAGRFRLRIEDERLTLLANAAPRRPLLEQLARELRFELVAPDVGNEPITVRVEGGVQGEALPLLLRDLLRDLLPDRAYRVEYRYDPVAARHELARLEIATAGALALSPGAEEAGPESAAAAAPAPRARPGAELSADALRQRLEDADFEERIEALTAVAPEGKALPLIIDRLANDPEPRVRAAAAAQLEFADTLASVDALVGALDDPDRQVVLAAIDALQLTEDTTVIQELKPFLEHEDEEIREAADAAIFMIED
jgi:hypothetical protein